MDRRKKLGRPWSKKETQVDPGRLKPVQPRSARACGSKQLGSTQIAPGQPTSNPTPPKGPKTLTLAKQGTGGGAKRAGASAIITPEAPPSHESSDDAIAGRGGAGSTRVISVFRKGFFFREKVFRPEDFFLEGFFFFQMGTFEFATPSRLAHTSLTRSPPVPLRVATLGLSGPS